ncbi:penicillin-binding transpeptidase domain-containing protein [Clostridium sp.]|uniref:penicillin-binding transpeptidase domain-containing protein n=1 Tax=Clostridium sp. TaxID=1506 RepID=UPI0025B90459|nr:penicillin-binding transpeptidase domain-containing protein [Clostridium sp.]
MYSGNDIFGNSNHKTEIRKRIWITMIIFILFFCLLIWKISNHMYFKAEPLKAMFNAQYTIDEKYGTSYKLLDRNGNNLLNYEMNYTAVIDPVDYFRFNEYTSKYDMEALTITLRNYNKNYDLDNIEGNGSFEKVRYKIDKITYDKIKDIEGVKGFYTYAVNEFISDGYWKIENLLTNPKYNKKDVEYPVFKDAESLEMQIYNKTKNNQFEKIRFDKEVDGEISEGKIIYPENNVNVRLTLDKEIQDKVEAILHEKKYKQIGVVLMESQTGKIRAMAQKDDTLNNVNLGIAYPGSIFKTIVSEAGLDLDIIDKNEIFTVDGKSFEKLDKHGNGYEYTHGEAYYDSSNDIYAQIGSKVGLENIYDYAEKQGLLSKILNLHYENSVKVNLSADDGNISQSVIGQTDRITPLQAINIPNTIINKGIYVQPSIIEAYVNDTNEVLEGIAYKTSQVLKSETAETMKYFMMDVVTKGTGKQAYIEGMDIGGKTGTTEYIDNGEECSDGWFVGFFNLNGKNYSMVVFVPDIDINIEGKNDEEGGTTAAPIFKEIIESFKTLKNIK